MATIEEILEGKGPRDPYPSEIALDLTHKAQRAIKRFFAVHEHTDAERQIANRRIAPQVGHIADYFAASMKYEGEWLRTYFNSTAFAALSISMAMSEYDLTGKPDEQALRQDVLITLGALVDYVNGLYEDDVHLE